MGDTYIRNERRHQRVMSNENQESGPAPGPVTITVRLVFPLSRLLNRREVRLVFPGPVTVREIFGRLEAELGPRFGQIALQAEKAGQLANSISLCLDGRNVAGLGDGDFQLRESCELALVQQLEGG